MQFKILGIVSLIFLVSISSCKDDDTSPIQEPYVYQSPSTLGDGWTTGSLQEAQMNVASIEKLTQATLDDEFTGIHSVLIIRHGKLVFEEYFNGYAQNDLHPLFSVSKSFSATLLGVAANNSSVAISQPITDFFPDHQLNDSAKIDIQLKHLLSMTAGLEWDEWSTTYIDPRNSHWQMMDNPSQIAYVLDLPMDNEPGKHFTYSTGLSNLMAPIIENITSQSVQSFARVGLFEPLNIASFDWPIYIDSYPSTGGSGNGLSLRPRDMAKLGQLYLDKGFWNEQRVVSEEWIVSSTEPSIAVQTDIAYGHQWWIRDYFQKDGVYLKEFDAVGDGGQFIFVFPEYELVIAFTGGNNTWLVERDKMIQPIEMVSRYILPAIIN